MWEGSSIPRSQSISSRLVCQDVTRQASCIQQKTLSICTSRGPSMLACPMTLPTLTKPPRRRLSAGLHEQGCVRQQQRSLQPGCNILHFPIRDRGHCTILSAQHLCKNDQHKVTCTYISAVFTPCLHDILSWCICENFMLLKREAQKEAMKFHAWCLLRSGAQDEKSRKDVCLQASVENFATICTCNTHGRSHKDNSYPYSLCSAAMSEMCCARHHISLHANMINMTFAPCIS